MTKVANGGVKPAGSATVIGVFIKPSVVVERAELYKAFIDLVIGMTGRDERYACLEVTGRELTITLADNEYDARHGAEARHG